MATKPWSKMTPEEIAEVQKLPAIERNILICGEHRAGMSPVTIAKLHRLTRARVDQILFVYGARMTPQQAEKPFTSRMFGHRLRLLFPGLTIEDAIALVVSRQW